MRRMRYRTLLSAVTVVLLVGTTPAFATDTKQSAPDSIEAPPSYTSQSLAWHTCLPDELPAPPPPGAQNIECATYQTPKDWTRVHNGSITIAVSRLGATNGTATASVLTNPGGPGAPGRSFPIRLKDQSALRAHQEIIGFDPRGTGKSTNITCGGATNTGKDLDPRNRDPRNLNLILDATQYAARSCQLKSGELGPLINTSQTIRDIDLLRVLLNREKINWIGYSAGTWLGAHYAQTFPEHTGRFVLDSNTEFTTTWQKSFDWQPMGFERRWRQDFLPWLAKYDSSYHFGTTGEVARQTYEHVRQALTQKPVMIDGSPVSANEFDSYIAGQIYSKKTFINLANYLVDVRTLTEGAAPSGQRDAAANNVRASRAKSKIAGPQPLVVPSEYDDAFDASFWTIPCNDGLWRGDRKSVIAQSQELMDKDLPLLGAGWLVQPCIFWPISPIPMPALTGQGVPPVVMVQSAHDPATPLEGAKRAHQAFKGSRLITVTGEGDHGIYANGNACVDTTVDKYLNDGVVPNDTSCPGQPLPAPPAP